MSPIKSIRMKIVIVLLLLQIPVFAISLVFLKHANDQNNRINLQECENTHSAQIRAINNTMFEAANTVVLLNSRNIHYPGDSQSDQFFFYQDIQNFLDIFESSSSSSKIIHYFLYNIQDDYFLKSSNNTIDIYTKLAFRDLLKKDNQIRDHLWQTISLQDSAYFMYAIHSQHYIFGVLLNCEQLLAQFPESPNVHSVMITSESNLICSGSDNPLLQYVRENAVTETGKLQIDGMPYQLRTINSNFGYSIITAVKTPSLFSFIHSNPLMLWAVILFLLLTVPLLFLFLNRIILVPIDYILFAFSCVQHGDLSFRAQEKMFSSEFQSINRSFNMMVRQIKTLRLDYYEEKIRQQQAERKFLQAISYPHFLLNNLNMINTFAYQHNEQGIHNAVMNLSKYLRYNMTSSSKLHTLNNDVESARSYLNLCQLAYPNRIDYDMQADSEILSYHFPPLVISTIVENCVKHGLIPGKSLQIRLCLDRINWGGQPALRFFAFNSGSQFPEAVLKKIQKTEDLQEEDTQHIGLSYVKQTLYHAFRNHSEFSIENNVEGAIVTALVSMDALNEYQNQFQMTEEAPYEAAYY